MLQFELTAWGDVLVFAAGVFVGSKGKDWVIAGLTALWAKIKAKI